MRITVENLEKFAANKPDIELFKKEYPEGAEILEVFNNPKFDKEFFYFIKIYFKLSEEEEEIYNKICEIEKSVSVLYSSRVKNSSFVSYSEDINKSNYVFRSKNVEDSNSINNSSFITKSKYIHGSSNVRASEKIIDSERISTSFNVVNSKDVTWGNCIISSSDIDDGGFLYKCKELTSCYFCGFVINSENCLFCHGVDGARYRIFNQEVEPQEFDRIREDLLYRLNLEISTFIQIDDDSPRMLFGKKVVYHNRFDSIFDGLSNEFYGWISTIPYYNEDLFINLFFSAEK